MKEKVTTRIIRTVPEVEEVRRNWTSWHCHPNSDIDFYLTILRARAEIVRPHVIIVYRNGQPDVILVGRIERKGIDLKTGYKTIYRPQARFLSFVYGGALGRLTSENSDILVDQIMSSLGNGEADLAVLSHIRADSPIYHSATRLPGLLNRDYCSGVQPHWTMTLSGSVDETYQAMSRDHRWELRRKAKKLMADFAGNFELRRFTDANDLDSMIHDIEEVATKTYQRGLGVGFADTSEMRERLHLAALKGWLVSYILYINNRPCAFWLGTLYQDTFHSDFLGYDPYYHKHSPGTFLLSNMIEDFCKSNVKAIDFGLGDARYKQRFGNCHWYDGSVYIFAPTVRGFMLNFVRTPTVIGSRFGEKALQRAKLLPQIKRWWRDRARQRVS